MPDPRRVAVIVATYQPPDGVQDLLKVLAAGDGPLLVVDDGSTDPVPPGAGEWIRLPRNGGLAAALNAGLRRAREQGATHVVTFDQDSSVTPGYLRALCRAWQDAVARGLRPGVVAPRDPGDVRYRGRDVDDFLLTTEVVQSGAMFCLAQLAEIGDFRESLVIDGVDSEACLRLGERGYDVIAVPLNLEHRIGRSRPVALAGRRVLITGHPAARHYTIVRNRIWLIREHAGRRPGWAFATARKTGVAAVLTLLFEPERGEKGRAIARGIRDGFRGAAQ